jgi:hypothetical protein
MKAIATVLAACLFAAPSYAGCSEDLARGLADYDAFVTGVGRCAAPDGEMKVQLLERLQAFAQETDQVDLTLALGEMMIAFETMLLGHAVIGLTVNCELTTEQAITELYDAHGELIPKLAKLRLCTEAAVAELGGQDLPDDEFTLRLSEIERDVLRRPWLENVDKDFLATIMSVHQ